jgi:two-component system, cell cycle sensor histidine kinase and response regulator CckA
MLGVQFVQFPAFGARLVNDLPHPHILIAEDEPAVRRALERFLGLKGCQVTAVSDGVAALSELGKGNFDVVISDIVMPIVGGVELWQKACESHPELRERWIFVSAYPESRLPAEARGRHLQKPVELSAVWTAVENVVGSGPARDAR